jgi:parallel beta-helix repeat protein
VSRNRLTGSDQGGLSVVGSAVTVSRNRVEHAGRDAAGIMVNANGICTIERNRVEDSLGGGFHLEVDASTIERNQALSGGGLDAPGYLLAGDGNTVEKNVTRDSGSDGFVLRGNDNTLTRNKAFDAVDNGILLQAPTEEGATTANNVLVKDVALRNGAQGLLNEGTGTEISGCKLRQNLLDLANDGGSLVDEGGNVFDTGGLTAPPAIPDP